LISLWELPNPIKLTNDALVILVEMVREWLCIKGIPESEKYLRDLREILKETLPE
jgi:hypothetical protein